MSRRTMRKSQVFWLHSAGWLLLGECSSKANRSSHMVAYPALLLSQLEPGSARRWGRVFQTKKEQAVFSLGRSCLGLAIQFSPSSFSWPVLERLMGVLSCGMSQT